MAAMRLLLLLIGLLSYVTLTRQQYVVAPVRSARRSLLQTAALVALERCLGSDIEVLDRSDADYEIVRLRTSQASVLSRFPSVYIRPSSGEQVRRVMRCLNKGDVPFVVRSGGHSYRGLTILNCGAVVDLGRLQHFRMIDNGKAAWVQAGHRLGPLYRKLWLAGEKIFPAGACPSVGLSGLLAAGGQGALTRYLSMSVDSVLGALVITPDGNLRYASPTSNRDLYFAIRGGTGGYGIVTRWKLRVHQAPKVFTSLSIDFPWSEESLKFVLGKFFDAKPWNWPNKLTLVRFFIGWLYGDKVGGDAPFRLVLNYWGPKKELDAFIKKTPFFKQVSYEVTRYVEGTYLQEMLHQAKIGWWDKTYTTVDDFTDKVVTDAWYDLKPIIWRGPGTTAASAYFGNKVPQAAVDFISEQMYSRKSTNLLFTVLRGASTKATLGPSGYDVHRSSVVNVEFLDDYSNGVASGEAWVRTMLKGMSPYTTGLQYYGYIHDIPKGMDPFSLFFGKKNGPELRKIWEKYDPKKLLYPFSLPTCK